MAHLDLVAHVSQSSFEMREMVRPAASTLYEQPQSQSQSIGQEHQIGPRYGRYRGGGGSGTEDAQPLVNRPQASERDHRYDGYFVAWELWHFLAFLWMLLLTAGLIVALVFALLTYNNFNSYKKSNNKDINSLESCCTNNTGAITIIQTNITTIAGSIGDINTDIVNIIGELAGLQNETAILLE
jgi:hypothetical protein